MYNFLYNCQFFQGTYAPQYYQWNYPLIYVPVSAYSLGQEINKCDHYQTQNHQKLISSPTGQQKSLYGQEDDQFQLEKDELSQNKSEKSIIKKKRKYYGTKNTEANIINQTFSYMNCCMKSRKVLQKLLEGDSRKIQIFYVMMKIVKRNLKKYVNRGYLKCIFDMDRSNLIYKLLSKGIKRLEVLSIEQFKKIFRMLVFYYFSQEMTTHLLSSNRLSKNTIGEHLKRRREIMNYIFQRKK